jgi:hypothetical protein
MAPIRRILTDQIRCDPLNPRHPRSDHNSEAIVTGPISVTSEIGTLMTLIRRILTDQIRSDPLNPHHPRSDHLLYEKELKFITQNQRNRNADDTDQADFN